MNDFKGGLAKKYSNITFDAVHLPGLQIGDKCNVVGEGDSEFLILDIIIYSENRYCFVLDAGWAEEVAKCHKDFML